MVYMFYILKTVISAHNFGLFSYTCGDKVGVESGNRVAKSQDLRIPKNKRNIHTRTIKIYDALFAARENEAKA